MSMFRHLLIPCAVVTASAVESPASYRTVIGKTLNCHESDIERA